MKGIQTDRHTNRQKDSQTDRHQNIHPDIIQRYTNRQIYFNPDIRTDIQTDFHTDTYTYIYKDIETYISRQTSKYLDRNPDRDIYPDRQTFVTKEIKTSRRISSDPQRH